VAHAEELEAWRKALSSSESNSDDLAIDPLLTMANQPPPTTQKPINVGPVLKIKTAERLWKNMVEQVAKDFRYFTFRYRTLN
jgi:hypothetical protein